LRGYKRAVAAAFGAVVALSACGGAANTSSGSNAPTSLKIMVGGLNKQIYLPNMLTQQLGYFKAENLDVTLIDEASGQSSEDQVIAGNVDAGSGSYNHTIELQAAGKNMETVCQFGIAPGEAEVVDASKAGSITSASDLKGQNLGVTEVGSGTHTLTLALLGQKGIAADQVHFLGVGAGDTFIAAMQQHRIVAGMTTEPTISRLTTSGQGKVLVDLRTPEATRAALGGDYPFIGVWMTNDYVNSHKDAVQRLVNAYTKTLKFIHSHTAEDIAAKMPADYYAGNKDLYITALKNQLSIFGGDCKMPSDGPATVLKVETNYVASMKGKTSIDLSKTYTNEFAGKAS
jgi:sulfonate transport system substrate-binding protein